MNEQILNALYESDELYHHGVIGMKWGVRRYQPYGEGGYDPEHKGKFVGSKRQMKKEFRKDNARLKDTVKRASVLGAALTKSSKMTGKAQEKAFDKGTQKAKNKAELEEQTKKAIQKAYKEAAKEAEKTVNEMRKKYGNDAVRDIVYKQDKYGNNVVNEKVVSGGEAAGAVLANIASVAVGTLVGLPVVYIYTPVGRSGRGSQTYSNTRADVKAIQKAKLKAQSI